MNSRQRCKIAMKKGVPDCVPVIPQICHPHAIKVLGLDFRKTMMEAVKEPSLINKLQIECARYYGVDGVRVWIHKETALNLYDDGENVWQIEPETNKKIGRLDFMGGGGIIPLVEKIIIEKESEIEEKIPVIPYNELLKQEKFKTTKKIVEDAKKNLFVITNPGSVSFQGVTLLRGKTQAMMDIIERPEFAQKILQRITEATIQNALAMIEIGVDALMIGDTFGGVIGPEAFKKFCVPYIKMFVDRIKKYDVCVYLHICGNSTQLFELVAETGVDCLEPLDPLGGVKVADAKRRLKNKTAIMGGVNTVKLAKGSLEEVKQDIQRCISEGAEGGGYLLACGDMLPTETEPEKVFEMVRAAHSYRYNQ